MNHQLNRAWAEINLDHIARNIREIRRITDKKAQIMGVVKADAYGHGVIEVAKTLLENGADRLAVAILDEAIQLRKQGIGVPVQILNHIAPEQAEEVIHYDITQTVFSLDLARALSDAAVKQKRKAKIHVKVDTGMNRIGFACGSGMVKDILEIQKLPGIIIEGIFTHFASADERDKSYTYMQFERFMGMVAELEREGVHIPVKHVCNSAGIIEFPEMHLDMVRPGVILYGLYPSEEVDRSRLCLKPAMTLKSRIIHVKMVEKDTPVSYGRIHTTCRKSNIATIPVGYADGYSRLLSNKGRILIHGEAAPVVGRICMDQFMVDVTGLRKEVCVGDEVVLLGRQGDMEIKAEEIAEKTGTINYEVVCLVGKRVPRVYTKAGEVVHVLNCLL